MTCVAGRARMPYHAVRAPMTGDARARRCCGPPPQLQAQRPLGVYFVKQSGQVP